MKDEIKPLAGFREEFERVRNQVVMGNAHLELWRSLSKRLGSDPKRLAANASPTFFGMTLESHLNTAILHAARIFDTHKDSLNIHTILKRANADKGTLSPEVAKGLSEGLRDVKTKLPKLESALKAVRTRRNKTLAHLDPMVVSKPDEVAQNSEITVEELRKIFVVAWNILNEVSVPYWTFRLPSS
jgi:AbiU2